MYCVDWSPVVTNLMGVIRLGEPDLQILRTIVPKKQKVADAAWAELFKKIIFKKF